MAFSGTYKGVRFRSLLELSVIKHFESEGLVIGDTMLYEVTRIPYGKTRIRNYVVDLTFPNDKLLVEVKPLSRADNRNTRTKREAAESWAKTNGWTYVLITEEELRRCGQVLTLDEVSQMKDVELGVRAMRTVRRREKRKKKR